MARPRLCARSARLRLGAAVATAVVVALVVALVALVAGLVAPEAAAAPGRITAVGAENEYANVISQIGGPYVKVSAVIRNPNTDPHTFEASTRVAQRVASARLVVQNGLGYDPFMSTIEAASPDRARKVIDVQTLLRLPSSTKNPHLWYDPKTMPAVAKAIAVDLTALAPSHRAYFVARLREFDASLRPWRAAIRALRARDRGMPVATTEPVADDMLQAAGIVDKTPWAFQADVMNGIDPSPQYTAYEEKLLRTHLVKALVYNHQVTDSLTSSLLGWPRRRTYRWSVSTRRCRPLATTTSVGWSRRSTRSRTPSPTTSRRQSCERRCPRSSRRLLRGAQGARRGELRGRRW